MGCGLAVAGSSLGLTLLSAEIALRLFAPQALLRDPDAFLPDPILGARLKPGFDDLVVTTEFSSRWSVNPEGYRGPVAGSAGRPASRIVALGDSFTFGYGVEEDQAWPALLERILNVERPPEARLEVVNLGVGGYGTWQETLWLEEKIDLLRPDLVLLAFYPGNDPLDNTRTAEAAWAGTSPGAGPAAGWAAGLSRTERLKRWLGSRLHIYSFVSTRADELLVRLRLRRLVYPFEMQVVMDRAPPEVERAWRDTGEALEHLGRLCRRRRTPAVVVLVPMKHQVSDGVWERLVAFYHDGVPEGLDRSLPARRLAALCGEAGLPLLDLTGGLRAAASAAGEDGRDFYWPRDQHWSLRGHAEAARLIADAARRLAPPARP